MEQGFIRVLALAGSSAASERLKANHGLTEGSPMRAHFCQRFSKGEFCNV